MNINLKYLTEKVCTLAQTTGKFIRNERINFKPELAIKKHTHDYVSYVDKESEKRIVTCLRELLPEAGFIAEEGSGSLTDEKYCWLVDPLDGTTNFIHNIAPYCISIALRHKEELILGVVYEICRDECFYTYKGALSFLNGHPIHVSEVDNLDDSFIALGFPYDSDRYKHIAMHLVKECYGNVTGIRTVGAAAAELCYVAAGRLDARIEGFIGPWDIAAGTLILQNAGGYITDFKGGEHFKSGLEVVGTNGKIHTQILELFRKNEIC